ncbi:MAG: hypothetical protein RQ760_22355 [Sedimentisphaerales bacterium]|nr:hypothetical protein [Sedimentisphaerales bacterium]
MPRPFAQSTAELVMQVTEAVQANGKADSTFVQNFCDLSATQADNALQLAADLGVLKLNTGKYTSANPLVSFVATPDESRKAALLRVVLESYEPFIVFRNRLTATNSADTAAQQTKAKLEIDAHREEIKDTLISLGTYTSALSSQGGGRYIAADHELNNQLRALAAAANDQAAAEAIIRQQIGARVEQIDRTEVIVPLANALLNATALRTNDAVADGARAVESFLARLADRLTVNLAGANGINQKLDKFRTDNHLPKKVVEAAKYLGQVRNAADHGVDVDPEVDNVWEIQQSTALQYVFVACSFISAALEREAGGNFII